MAVEKSEEEEKARDGDVAESASVGGLNTYGD